MERFSNNREDYWNQIKKELLDSNDSEKFRFQYLEMGQLFSHGYSVAQTELNPSQLIFKIWNAEYDNNRFDKDVFNLDRLAIRNSKVELNPQELKKINKLLESELNLIDWGGITLDGLFCQFEIHNKKFDWNTNNEINSNLTELVELIRNKVVYNTM